MKQATARSDESSVVAPPRSALFKADRPRAIDRYIDYFEGRPAVDVCGEGLLDSVHEPSVNELPRVTSNA